MKKLISVLLLLIASHLTVAAQNVGIGTTSPGFPLNFSNALGDKISLYGNTGTHYGFGIQGGLLQMYTDAGNANIVFGYGRSGSFTERMRIINSGDAGLSLNGRITLRNGTSPLDVAYGSGIWMYNADNTAMLGFIGVQNNQNLGFYGGPGGWGFTYNAINSRVGIGNNNPNAPLTFAATLEKKITLYPGATGDVGFGVSGNRLQIYADNPNADVAIGYDAAGTFNERFAVKPNAALAVNGNIGNNGQLLMSSGNAAAQWMGLGSLLQTTQGTFNSVFLGDQAIHQMPYATLNISVDKPSRVMLFYNSVTSSPCSIGPCMSTWYLRVSLNGAEQKYYYVQSTVYPLNDKDAKTLGPDLFDLPAGTHTISFSANALVNTPLAGLSAFALIIPQ